MDIIWNQYRLEYELVRLIIELEFDQEMHQTVKVNRILYNYYYDSNWKDFMKK